MEPASLAALITEAAENRIRLTFEAGDTSDQPYLYIQGGIVQGGRLYQKRKTVQLGFDAVLTDQMMRLHVQDIIREVKEGFLPSPAPAES